MMHNIKNRFIESRAKVMAFSLALMGGLIAATPTFAAVDPAVASTTGMVVDTMKENVVGAITANISNIVIVGVIIFSLTFIWKLARRFMK